MLSLQAEYQEVKLNGHQTKMRLIAMTSLLLICLLGVTCAPGRGFDSRLSSIVKPYRFSVARWESKALLDEANQLIFGRREKVDDEVNRVTEYFSAVERIKTLRSEVEAINTDKEQTNTALLKAELSKLQERTAALAHMVEKIIEEQIRESLAQQGIFNPMDKYVRLKVSFPPLNFRLEKPPHLLVISPRDSIESMREITLKQETSLEQMEDIEANVDKLGVSSLVVGLGGFSTYPSVVTNNANLWFTIDTVTHEWLHQYLVFKPLGFHYLLDLLGVSRNYEIATINETLVSMVSEEIGAIVCERYYPEHKNGVNQGQLAGTGFDFNREMREIRRAVDKYLAQGEIEQAEEFMEQKRRYLATKGYYIRKLNQAYFAFHGTYAYRPTSISPIGLELKKLRSQSTSLKDFLNTVAAMTSREDLRVSIK
ncbi:hypothetical protein ACFLVA_01660 [Chloroflexota bacterium]